MRVTFAGRRVKIRKGYKYQLAEDALFFTSIIGYEINTTRLSLSQDGTLIIREGYACDGPSGFTIDRKENMSASVLHDALYQLMRMGGLPHYVWPEADAEYAKQMKKCGAWNITVRMNLWGLSIMQGTYAKPKYRKRIYEYPQ